VLSYLPFLSSSFRQVIKIIELLIFRGVFLSLLSNHAKLASAPTLLFLLLLRTSGSMGYPAHQELSSPFDCFLDKYWIVSFGQSLAKQQERCGKG